MSELTKHSTDADVLRKLTRLIFTSRWLNEETMKQRWPAFEAAFMAFDPAAVAAFDPPALVALYDNTGLIRHRQKLAATVSNARTLVRLAEAYGGFGEIIDALAIETYERRSEFMRATFTCVGPVVAYEFLLSAGLADDADRP